MELNKYLECFISSTIKGFRYLNSQTLFINIEGMYYTDEDSIGLTLLSTVLIKHNIIFSVSSATDKTQFITVTYQIGSESTPEVYQFQLHGLASLILLSSKTNLSIPELLTIRIIGHVINKIKIIYKAIVLDLDDTLWNGTVSEIGTEGIKQNLRKDEGFKFISFMNYILRIGEELGVFIAICSKNKINVVCQTIDYLNTTEFPLKHHIDIIAANENDKSSNITKIANRLSILPNAIIFIDDNVIMRNEVRQKLPTVFVPDWSSHEELISILETSGVFERPYITKNSQKRRIQFRIIQTEREKNYLPNLSCYIQEDPQHTVALDLYSKSNQFNFSQIDRGFNPNCRSISFTLFTSTNEDLGICSSITYEINKTEVIIHNWAISCRFFEIGLEEFIISYLFQYFDNMPLRLYYKNSGRNERINIFLNKYSQFIVIDSETVTFHPKYKNFFDNGTNILQKI